MSTFQRSPQSSSVFSFDLSDRNSLTPDDGSVFASGASEFVSPRVFNFSSPAGAYSFTNPGYVDHCISPAHLPSPMSLIRLGSHHSSSSSSKVPRQTSSPKTSLNSDRLENEKRSSRYANSRNHSQASNSTHYNHPENHFFGPKFNRNDKSPSQVQQSCSISTAIEVEKRNKKPPPPQRSSSIRSSEDLALQTPSRTALATAVSLQKQNFSSHYQTPRSPPMLKAKPSDANQLPKTFAVETKQSVIGSSLNSDDTAQTSPVMTQETSETLFPSASGLAGSELITKFQKAVSNSTNGNSARSIVTPLVDVSKSHSISLRHTSQDVSKPSCKSSTLLQNSLENQDVENHVPARIEENVSFVQQNFDGTASVISLQTDKNTFKKRNCSEVTKQLSAPNKLSETSKLSSKLQHSTDDEKDSCEALLPSKVFSIEKQEKANRNLEISQSNSTSTSMALTVTSSDLAPIPNEETTEEIKTQALSATSANATSSATTPPPVEKVKPALKPKPKSFSGNRTLVNQVAPAQEDEEKQMIRQKTASARAAFFGVSALSSAPENRVLQESCRTPKEQEKINESNEPNEDVIPENAGTAARQDEIERQKTDDKVTLNSVDLTRKKGCVKEPGFVEVKSKNIPTVTDDQFIPAQTGCDQIEPSVRDTVSERTQDNNNAVITNEDPKDLSIILSSSETSVHYPLHTSHAKVQKDGSKTSETLHENVTQKAFQEKVCSYHSTTTTSGNLLKSRNSTENLDASVSQTDVKSVKTAALSGNSASVVLK